MRQKQPAFDRERLQPAIRKSICTGEQTAGFLDRQTGRFCEDRLLRSEKKAICRKRKTGWPAPRSEVEPFSFG